MGTQGKRNKVKRDFRQIRSAIVMVCVAFTVLGTSSYAWFTISNQPKVTGIALTAGATDGLKVCGTANGVYGDSVVLTEIFRNNALSPVTTLAQESTGALAFGKPVYAGNTVTGTTKIVEDNQNADNNELKDYVAKYTFWIKAEGTGPVNVCLKGGAIVADPADADNKTGSFVIKKTESTASKNAAYAIRVGLVQNKEWVLYIPNSDGANQGQAGDSANNGTVDAPVNPVLPTKVYNQNEAGMFLNPPASPADISPTLFTIDAGTGHQVDMYIWMEGTDVDCINQIQTDQLVAQLQFTAVR